MNKLSTLVLAALLAAPALPALAQHAGHSMSMAADAKGTGEGEIRRIDAANKLIAIKHGPITGTMSMHAMTMVFSVKDAKVLGQLKAGDKVKFDVEQQGDALVITKLEAVK